MKLSDLVLVSRQVGATRSRLEKVEALALFLRALRPEEIAAGVSYLCGELRQGRVGVGPALVTAAAGTPHADGPPVELLEIDAALDRIAATTGSGSAAARAAVLAALMARASGEERDFLVHLLLGELRQGALEGLMAEALARAAGVPASEVRRALMLGERGAVALAALSEGSTGLARFALVLFQPVQPMLARTAEDAAAAVSELGGEAALEYKLDGARVQVHRRGSDVRVFTRGLNDVTEAVPELVDTVRALPGEEVILDGEAICLREDGRPHSFQTTMSRFGSKLDVAAGKAERRLRPFFFDLLQLDGRTLIDLPARERAALLAALTGPELLVPRRIAADAPAAAAFLAEALGAGHEGIVAKALDAPYAAGSRGAAWLKVKPAHTLDLVVLAVEWGSGRRKGWLSNLHLGARDPAAGGFVMLGKTFKGMTDAMLEWQTRKLLSLETGREGHVVHVRPELVVEIALDGVQASPHYPGGMALRFARVRRYREDKPAAEADTLATVRALFARGEGREEAPA